MRNGGRIISGLFFFAAFLAALAVAFASTKMPEQDVTIFSTEVFKQPKKGPVTFPHVKHKGLKCIDCHHEIKDGKNVWQEGQEVKKCQTCHKSETEGKMVKLDKAFHDQCKKCHEKLKKEKKAGGPTACNKCHPKATKDDDK